MKQTTSLGQILLVAVFNLLVPSVPQMKNAWKNSMSAVPILRYISKINEKHSSVTKGLSSSSYYSGFIFSRTDLSGKVKYFLTIVLI